MTCAHVLGGLDLVVELLEQEGEADAEDEGDRTAAMPASRSGVGESGIVGIPATPTTETTLGARSASSVKAVAWASICPCCVARVPRSAATAASLNPGVLPRFAMSLA